MFYHIIMHYINEKKYKNKYKFFTYPLIIILIINTFLHLLTEKEIVKIKFLVYISLIFHKVTNNYKFLKYI